MHAPTSNQPHGVTQTLVSEIAGASALRASFGAPDGRLDLCRIGFPQPLECGEGDHVGVFVFGDTDGSQMVVPRLRRPVRLPLRIGEKVVARFAVDAFVFPASSEIGFQNEAQARDFLIWCRQSRPGAALFFPDLFVDTPLATVVASARQTGYLVVAATPARHLLHRFGPDYESFFESRKSKYKNQLRKNERVLQEKAGGKASLVEYRSVEAVSPFLGAAAAINQRTYQFRLFEEVIQNDDATRRAYEASARQGHFRSFILWCEDQPLCFVLGEQRQDGVYHHIMTGFDPDWRDCGPGINCNAMLLKHLYAVDTPRCLDFGSGDAEYKRLFSTEARVSSSPTLLPDSLSCRTMHAILQTSDRLNQRAVRLLGKLGLKDRIKRFVRMRSFGQAPGGAD